MWGCLAATEPVVTAVHLCHQAYMGPRCGFSEQLQMLIPAGLQEAPESPSSLSSCLPAISFGCRICVLP